MIDMCLSGVNPSDAGIFRAPRKFFLKQCALTAFLGAMPKQYLVPFGASLWNNCLNDLLTGGVPVAGRRWCYHEFRNSHIMKRKDL